MAKRRAECRDKGICIQCTKRPARDGRSRCNVCAPLHSESVNRIQTEKRKPDRFCVDCCAYGFHREDCATQQPQQGLTS